jgi:hypothetical protein
LDWINSNSYDDQIDYLLFGRDSLHEIIDELTAGEAANTSDSEAIQRLVSDLKNSYRPHARFRTNLAETDTKA